MLLLGEGISADARAEKLRYINIETPGKKRSE